MAGITISLVIGQNGIITRAKDAKEEQRGASVEEQVNLWRADNEMAETLGEQYTETDDQIINRLYGIGLLTENDLTQLKDKENNSNREVTIGSRTISFKLEVSKEALKIKVTTGADGVVGLPVSAMYNDFIIDWGDGTIENSSFIGKVREEGKKVATIDIKNMIKVAGQPSNCMSHTYTEKDKEYVVTITGTCTMISTGFSNTTPEKVLEIVQWGETGLEDIILENAISLTRIASPSEKSFEKMTGFESAFAECSELEAIPADFFAHSPNVTNLNVTFMDCSKIKTIPANLFSKSSNCTQLENYAQIPDYWKNDLEPT